MHNISAMKKHTLVVSGPEVKNQVMSSGMGRLSNQKRSDVKSPKTEAIYKDCRSFPTFHIAMVTRQLKLPIGWETSV